MFQVVKIMHFVIGVLEMTKYIRAPVRVTKILPTTKELQSEQPAVVVPVLAALLGVPQ